MKTKDTIKYITLSLVCILLNLFNAKSQSRHLYQYSQSQFYSFQSTTPKIGVGLSESVSANGHGYTTHLKFKYKKLSNEYIFGLNFQNENRVFAGCYLGIQKYLGGKYEPQNLYFHTSFRIYANCVLCERLNSQFHDSEYLGELEKFLTTDLYLGFGLKKHLSQNVYIDSKIGIGAYYNNVRNTDNRKTVDNLFRNDIGIGSLFEFGIHYEF